MGDRVRRGLIAVKVVPFGRKAAHPPDVQPQLSQEELTDIREILREHAIIKECCPTARRLLDED